MSYILVTPVKNEENNLSKLADCIVNQTILPYVWIILNDNSTDRTQIIIDKLENTYSWIKGVTIKEATNRDLDEHFGKICNLAIKEAIRYCEKKKLNISYFVKVDADIILPNNCIEEILIRLDLNNEIGIASPYIQDLPNRPINQEKLFTTDDSVNNYSRFDMLEPSDGLRFYRYITFNDIGGIPETIAPDVVALAKAKLRGWKVERFNDVGCYKTRKTSSSIRSIFQGYFIQGERRYYLNYPSSIIIFQSVLEFLKGHPNLGIAIFLGFFNSFISKKEKINDNELRDYFYKKRPKEILNLLLRGTKCV
jgi:glycosyltransferase involved in cell wall biosynthesis